MPDTPPFDFTFPMAPNPGMIKVGDTLIPFRISRRKNSRRLSLRFSPAHQNLHVIVPPHCCEKKIQQFLKTHEEWILKHTPPLPEPQLLSDGVLIKLLDEPHLFRYCLDSHSGFQIENKEILVKAPHKDNFSSIARHALKTHAHIFFKTESHRFAQQLGKQPQQIKIKDYKSRWGSCSKDAVLSFSWRLLFAPLEVAMYVCAHEVAHLQEMNHQKAFWSLVKELYPDFKTSRNWLKKNGHVLFSYEFISS